MTQGWYCGIVAADMISANCDPPSEALLISGSALQRIIHEYESPRTQRPGVFSLLIAAARDHSSHFFTTTPPVFQMCFSGITPRTLLSGYTLLQRPITVPGFSTLLQPIST